MILIKAFHDAGERLKRILHPDTVFALIGVSFRFFNPALEKMIHEFWTVKSSKMEAAVILHLFLFIPHLI